jgi:hypothetical protein
MLASLTLPLLVLWIRADHPHHPMAMDELAFIAHLLYGRPYFHGYSFSSEAAIPRLRSATKPSPAWLCSHQHSGPGQTV